MAELSSNQKTTRDVFTGCADFVEENEYEGTIGQCVDESIISEEEGGFQLTELGEKARQRGANQKLILPNGIEMRFDRT